MFAAIRLPNFGLQTRLRERAWSAAAALAQSDGLKSCIAQINPAAAAAGVELGFTSSQALARCPELEIVFPAPEEEALVSEWLSQLALHVSPLLECTEPGVCTLDLKMRRDANHAAWAGWIIAQLAAQGFDARIGVAANPDLAQLVARRARPYLEICDACAFLKDLPLGAIGLSWEIRGILALWGLRTLGEFTALGREEVEERLGLEGVLWHDRASGKSERLLRLEHPAETYAESVEFEGGVETLEPLLFTLRGCLESLQTRLADAYLLAAEVTLEITFDDKSRHERIFEIPSPTRQPEVLQRILHSHLETLQAAAPAVAMRLLVTPTVPHDGQFSLFGTASRDPNALAETLGRVGAFLGLGRVGSPQMQDTHLPDAFALQAAALEPPPEIEVWTAPKDELVSVPAGHKVRRIAQTEIEVKTTSIKPNAGLALRRYRPPSPATVELRDHIPAHVESAICRGAVQQARGPWRWSAHWWEEGKARASEEWDVQLAPGALYRLAREGEQWAVEGTYD